MEFENKDTYETINNCLMKKSFEIWCSEQKDTINGKFVISNFQEVKIKNRLFYIVQTNRFKKLIEDGAYLEAIKTYPECFGTNDAKDVLNALYQSDKDLYNKISFERYVEYISNENFAYIVEYTDGKVHDKILRLDFYLKLDPNRENASKKDFTGGLLHAFRHFTLNDINLSTFPDKQNSIWYFDTVVDKIIMLFFFGNPVKETNNNIETSYLYETYKLSGVFHYRKEANVYFLTTMYMRKKKGRL